MKKSYAVLGVVLLAVGFSVACSLERAEAKPKWEVEGHYAEACQCNVPCPCNFAQKPTYGNCDNTSIFQIDRGRYEEVPLDGLTVIVVGSSPEGERWVDTVGNLTFVRYYVDERASEEQRAALEEIGRALNASYQRLPVLKLSKDEQVSAVPMQVSVTDREAEAKIPDVLEFQTEALTGADGQERIEIVNGSVVVDWMPRIWSGQSKTYKYTDAQEWDYSGRSAYFAGFKAHSNMESLQAGSGASQH